ncbi:hypothetical protein [Streptomyces sp. NPDC051561]|uniref:hypothetical protein n=1 Tax=Streptomyces sp. NPDC051561 TaxID=3365658 RepID=UPI003793E843
MATRTMTDQRTAPRNVTFVQVAIALQTLALFFQAVTAGLLLSSSTGMLLHDVGSRVMYGMSMLYVLAAVLAWRRGGASPRPVLYASGFLVLASVQVAVGIAHVASLHVPLGILMFGLSVLALGQVVSARPAGRRGGVRP